MFKGAVLLFPKHSIYSFAMWKVSIFRTLSITFFWLNCLPSYLNSSDFLTLQLRRSPHLNVHTQYAWHSLLCVAIQLGEDPHSQRHNLPIIQHADGSKGMEDNSSSCFSFSIAPSSFTRPQLWPLHSHAPHSLPIHSFTHCLRVRSGLEHSPPAIRTPPRPPLVPT